MRRSCSPFVTDLVIVKANQKQSDQQNQENNQQNNFV